MTDTSKTDNDIIQEAVSKASEQVFSKNEPEIESSPERDSDEVSGIESDPTIEAAPVDETEAPAEKPRKQKSKKSQVADSAPLEEEQPAELEATDSQEETIPPEEEVQVQPQSSIQPPEFWDAKEKAAFARAPKVLQNALRQEYERVQQHVQRIASEAQQAVNFQTKAQEITAPVKNMMKLNRLSEHDILERAITWNQEFQERGAPAFVDFLATFGMTPHDLLQGEGYQEQAYHPQVAAMQQELADLRAKQDEIAQFRQNQEQQFQAQRQQTLQAHVNNLMARPDYQGKALSENWDFYEPLIAQQIRVIKSQNPGLQEGHLIDRAYKAVMQKMNGFGLGASNPLQNGKADQVKKAKAAASSISGGAGPKPQIPKNLTPEEAVKLAAQMIDDA